MRLKTKLVVAITGLVFLVAGVLSMLYLTELLRQQISQSYQNTDLVAHQVLFATRHALETGMTRPPEDLNDPASLRIAVANTLRRDEGLSALLSSVIRYSPTVFDVSIADNDNRAFTSTDPGAIDTILPSRPLYIDLRDGNVIRLLSTVFGPPRVYDVVLPLGRDGQPFATVHVGIRTTFLRNLFQPWISAAIAFTGLAILLSLLASALVANLALQPLEDISIRLDALDRAEAETAGELEAPRSGDAVVLVSNKIEKLGRRMRNVEEVFSALKENLDQILTNLQDGIILFTRTGRAVLVSSSVERFLLRGREDILGAEVREIFDGESLLGRTVREAFDGGIALVQEEITTETDRHIEVSLDFIREEHASPNSLGALLTLHDLESVQEIESELELSRRMAAIGRLTSGVGHEVKNPINAIVVHLELLKNKLDSSDARALRHLEIIESEIQRLDRVVQTLVDFSRPVELRLQESDLRSVVTSVLMLASAEMETRNVKVVSRVPERPVLVKIDTDLVRQALLNVILNGAQAMSEGGVLEVRLVEDGRTAMLSVRDEGEGIPDDLLEKIFDLYFTTKKEGSGIGLAMTYRIIQLHNGSVDVESVPGEGTTFTLRIPLNNPVESRLRGHLVGTITPSVEPQA
ncbi:MAG TPA: ATP-binding protein [Acidisarcina sp.]|nr:ATP-binding protein [Acidisarcina sp.]